MGHPQGRAVPFAQVLGLDDIHGRRPPYAPQLTAPPLQAHEACLTFALLFPGPLDGAGGLGGKIEAGRRGRHPFPAKGGRRRQTIWPIGS